MNFGMSEMIFIFFLGLVLFGPKKLPEIGREIGRFMAEFKRASDDFRDQLQNEIDRAGVDVGPISRPEAQQTSSFTSTLLPPELNSAISKIDSAHARLMETARTAFDVTLYPSEVPVAPSVLRALTRAPSAEFNAVTATHKEVSSVEAVTDHITSHPAPDKSCSATQSD
jgi:sec-independent protein translocase protein TatB